MARILYSKRYSKEVVAQHVVQAIVHTSTDLKALLRSYLQGFKAINGQRDGLTEIIADPLHLHSLLSINRDQHCFQVD